MKLNKTTKIGFAGAAGCAGVLGLLTVAMLCPMRSEGANAACGQPGSDECITSQAAVETRVNVPSMISISLDNAVDIDVSPTVAGAFSAKTANMNVATNNKSGYGIYMATSDGKSTLNGGAGNSQAINATTGATGSAMANNTWGYNLTAGATVAAAETLTYSAVPTATSSTIKDVTSPNTATGDQYKLTFGTKVSTDLKPDTYSNSVIVSVVATPDVATHINQMTNMQQMTPEICANSAEGETKQLADLRDGKRYYVTKLKDNNEGSNCWMTQNLALDLEPSLTLTPDNSNVTQNKTVATGHATDTGEGTGDGKTNVLSQTDTAVPAAVSSPSQTTTYSWDLGTWLLATPTETTSCGDVTDISTCTKVGFIDVSKDGWKPGFTAQPGQWTMSDGTVKNTYVAADPSSKTYDPHYLIGNYYQWNTATAGSGGKITSSDATESICPKGWKLPTSGDSAESIKNDSFFSLLTPYGVASSLQGGVISEADRKAYSIPASQTNYNIAEAPLYFVRSGNVGIYGGKLWGSGINGYGWSSWPHSNGVYAYFLGFNGSVVGPSSGLNRWFGFPLRCLAN